MDGSQLSELLHQLRPETTLFIISSKSFGTIDTLSNAQTVRQWLEKALGKQERVVKAILLVFLQKLTKCQTGDCS